MIGVFVSFGYLALIWQFGLAGLAAGVLHIVVLMLTVPRRPPDAAAGADMLPAELTRRRR